MFHAKRNRFKIYSLVPFYSAYNFLAFVSQHKAIAWLFSITPSIGQLPHGMHEKNPYKIGNNSLRFLMHGPKDCLDLGRNVFLYLIKPGCTYMESLPNRFVGFFMVS
jgi:hypothetical protein